MVDEVGLQGSFDLVKGRIFLEAVIFGKRDVLCIPLISSRSYQG
jgi:hypothetical protein